MKNREDIFKDLIKKVFFNRGNVKLLKEDDVISLDGSQVTDAKYTMFELNKFSDIFRKAFSGCEIIMNNSTKKEPYEFSELIKNTISYFKSIDIYLNENALSTISDTVKGVFFCYAITNYILPFIFDGTDPNEDAEKVFEQVKLELGWLFTRIEDGCIVGTYAKAKDFPVIFDSDYDYEFLHERCKDFYAILVNRTVVEYDMVVLFCEAAIYLKKNNVVADKEDIYSLEKIVGDFLKYPFSKDAPFIESSTWSSENNDANGSMSTDYVRFPLSDVVIPRRDFIPRYYYYITRINQSIIDKYNDDIKNRLKESFILLDGQKTYINEENFETEFAYRRIDHQKLNNILMRKSVDDFRKKYEKKITEYNENVIKYIEDMIRRIATADYTCLIMRDSGDVEACQKFTKHFNINYEIIIKWIEDDPVLKCYDLIEEKIRAYASQLEQYAEKIAKDIKQFKISKAEEHYNNIGEYIKNGNLESAIRLKSKKLSEDSGEEVTLELPHTEGNLNYVDMYNLLSQYQKRENTFEYIYESLKKYHDIIGKVIGK